MTIAGCGGRLYSLLYVDGAHSQHANLVAGGRARRMSISNAALAWPSRAPTTAWTSQLSRTTRGSYPSGLMRSAESSKRSSKNLIEVAGRRGVLRRSLQARPSARLWRGRLWLLRVGPIDIDAILLRPMGPRRPPRSIVYSSMTSPIRFGQKSGDATILRDLNLIGGPGGGSRLSVWRRVHQW